MRYQREIVTKLLRATKAISEAEKLASDNKRLESQLFVKRMSLIDLRKDVEKMK